jgi:hypothetical protein
MSKRLQVVLGDAELRDIQRAARRNRLSVAEWVRQALRAARLKQPESEAGKKLQCVRSAAEHTFPTGSVVEMLSEIEEGYRTRESP